MDPITHSFLGASLAATGLRRAVPHATATLVLAANAPDIDIVAQLFGGPSALAWRRGITHGIPSLVVLPLLVAAVVLAWDRRRNRERQTGAPSPTSPWGIIGLAYLGVWTHPVLDWLNTYGMRWLAPFDGRWSYGDAIFIVDPWLWLLLGGPLFLAYSKQRGALALWGILGGAMTLLVTGTPIVPLAASGIWLLGISVLILLRSRRGASVARDRARRVESTVRLGVGIATAYVLSMVLLNPIAERIARAEAADVGIEPVVDLMVGPVPANPFAGEVVLRTENGYRRGRFSWLSSPRLRLEPGLLENSPDEAAIGLASQHPDARAFLVWSRFPWYRVSERDGEGILEIRDVRYLDRNGSALFGVTVPIPREVEGSSVPPVQEPDSILNAVTFEAAWSRIRETHYDPELRGLDWEGVRRDLLPRAKGARTSAELRMVIREMLAHLGESHFVLIPGESASPLQGGGGEGDPGIEVRWVEGELVVTKVRDRSAAERSGVLPGWVLEWIDGASTDSLLAEVRGASLPGGEEGARLLWLPAMARNRTMGEVGSGVTLRVRDERDRRRTIELLRDPPAVEATRIGNLPPIRAETNRWVEEIPDGGRVGVIHWSAWLPAVIPEIGDAIDDFRGMDGIVLDLRGNPGGLGALVMGIGGHFLNGRESLGTLRTRETELRFVTNPQRVNRAGSAVEPYAGPLAILVDPMTGSTSEVFAAGMQALGRARIFGETTAGQTLPALITLLPNGDRLMHAVADFVAPDGTRLEGVGVRPDVVVPPRRDALLEGGDLAMTAALRWIQSQR